MACTEAYKEHIMYTFYGFCKVVIRNADITAWRDQQRRNKRELSLEYLTEEMYYPLGTSDEYFTAPYEKYPVTICGQTIILTNGKLAVAHNRQHTETGNHKKVFCFFATIFGIFENRRYYAMKKEISFLSWQI